MKNDLTALTAVWIEPTGTSTQRPGTGPRKTVWPIGHAPTMRPMSSGSRIRVDLTAVPGSVIDKTFVAAQVAELVAEYDVQFLAFDVAGIADFIAACEDIGFPVWKFEGKDKPEGKGLKLVPHAQGKKRMFEERQLTMPTSIERYEDKILSLGLTVEASPVTYMCAANTMIDVDGQGNRCFDKKRSRGRIDGNVTNAMAVGAALADFEAKKPKFQLLFV
jgi:phage terminase large subunit-like protein